MKHSVDWVSMQDGLDWVLRPVLHNCCRYESLLDGTLTLVDIAIMNEALDVRAYNQRLFDEAGV